MNWPFLTFTIRPRARRRAARGRSGGRGRRGSAARRPPRPRARPAPPRARRSGSARRARSRTAGEDLEAALDARAAVGAEARAVGLVVAGLEDAAGCPARRVIAAQPRGDLARVASGSRSRTGPAIRKSGPPPPGERAPQAVGPQQRRLRSRARDRRFGADRARRGARGGSRGSRARSPRTAGAGRAGLRLELGVELHGHEPRVVRAARRSPRTCRPASCPEMTRPPCARGSSRVLLVELVAVAVALADLGGAVDRARRASPASAGRGTRRAASCRPSPRRPAGPAACR